MNSSHTHKKRLWYLLLVPFKISDYHPRNFYMEVPPPPPRLREWRALELRTKVMRSRKIHLKPDSGNLKHAKISFEKPIIYCTPSVELPLHSKKLSYNGL